MTRTASRNRSLLVATLLVTWLVWGSSFVAIAYALEALPPLLLMATRFMAAGAIAMAIGAWASRGSGRSAWRATRREWRDAAVVGAGFVGVGMGATSWAATRLPTGIAALLVSTAPLWLVLLQLAASRGRSANGWALVGVGIGTLGVAALVVGPGGGSAGPGIDVLAAVVLVASNGVWAATSLFARTAARPASLLQGVGMQMLAGGTLLALLGAACGELGRFHPGQVGALVSGSWLYLVVAASIGGFVAYGWLLEHASATTASTHAFVNPLVAVALGAAMLGEAIDSRVLVAGLAIVAAVVLLMVGESRVPSPASVGSSQPSRAWRRRQRRRDRVGMASAARTGRSLGWSPAPTPSFAARREARPLHVTDGMDALEIDRALDGFGA